MKYRDASSFRLALEVRLTALSKEQEIDLQWLRKKAAFDRLLARIFFNVKQPRWFLKGRYAMELRFSTISRTTKDMDLSFPFPGPGVREGRQLLEQIRDELQELAGRDLKDWFVYAIGAPIMELEAAPDGGARFPVSVTLAGRKFTSFSLDVGIGDAVIFEPEWTRDHNLLKFADIVPSKIPLLPREQQVAEKIHAYTLLREGSPNSRTRDLVDMVLLMERGALDKGKVRQAISATFERRHTHSIPLRLSRPPEGRSGTYAVLARDCGVGRKAVEEAFELLERYWKELFDNRTAAGRVAK